MPKHPSNVRRRRQDRSPSLQEMIERGSWPRQPSRSQPSRRQRQSLSAPPPSAEARDCSVGDDGCYDIAMATLDMMATESDGRLEYWAAVNDFDQHLLGSFHSLDSADGQGDALPAADAVAEAYKLPATLPTAAQAALATYGSLVKMDGALCRKLAREPALREPQQRRPHQRLNTERRSNVEALLAHVAGEPAGQPCRNCRKGHGPWTECIVYNGQMCGSCSNCWFNASGSRCTFHENNKCRPPQVVQSSPSGGPPDPADGACSQQPPAAAPTPPLPRPPPPPAPAPTPANPLLGPQRPLPELSLNLGSLRSGDPAQWRIADAAGQAVDRGLSGLGSISRRQRLIARIEAAAEELGLRIAEYDDFMCSPEGLADEAGLLLDSASPAAQPPPPAYGSPPSSSGPPVFAAVASPFFET